jgi:hypothetical protein
MEYRGVLLPEGMMPELAAKLESLVCGYLDAANGTGDDDIPLPVEFGVILFEEIRGTLRS